LNDVRPGRKACGLEFRFQSCKHVSPLSI
jgi:hypothetical protein